jgi:hypothetical protein
MREGDKPFGLKSKENELLPRILHFREPIKSLSLEPRLIGTYMQGRKHHSFMHYRFFLLPSRDSLATHFAQLYLSGTQASLMQSLAAAQ